jgi:hypothetical protein
MYKLISTSYSETLWVTLICRLTKEVTPQDHSKEHIEITVKQLISLAQNTSVCFCLISTVLYSTSCLYLLIIIKFNILEKILKKILTLMQRRSGMVIITIILLQIIEQLNILNGKRIFQYVLN